MPAWRAQYYEEGDVLVEDLLTFTRELAFSQNISSFPFQECTTNWLLWEGQYVFDNVSSLELEYRRCTQSAAGCVRCGPTRNEEATVAFSADCDVLTLKYPADGGRTVTYFPETGSQAEREHRREMERKRELELLATRTEVRPRECVY